MTSDQLVGSPLTQFCGAALATLQSLAQVRSGESVTFIVEHAGLAWEVHCHPTRSVESGEDAESAGISGFAIDVTELRNAEAEVRWRGREMAALNAIMADVSSSLEFSVVLETLRKQLAQQLLIPGGVLHLLDFSRFDLELHRHWGVPPVVVERIGSRVSDLLREASSLLASTEIATGLSETEIDDATAWRTGLCIPLLANDQLLGVLTLFGEDAATFDKHRPSFFDMLGCQVGTALQNARLFQELRSGREQLQSLTRRIVDIQEAESARLARELHDEIGQIVTGLKLTLDVATRETTAAGISGAAKRLEEAGELVRDLMRRVRQMSLDLRPTALDDLGLLPALLGHFERYSRQTGITVAFHHVEIERRRFPGAVETAAYRIVQESLTNVARYADIKEVSVLIHAASDGLHLWIEDKGKGFDPQITSPYSSSGLSGMRERAIGAGGTFSINSMPDQGTTITARLPIPPATVPSEETQ